jgi:TorA maturation chaperone TorD
MTTGASADVLRLLAGFIEAPGAHRAWADALDIAVPTTLEAWQAAHTETFLVQCYPYASVYLGEQGAIGGEAADRVAGFRRLLGAGPEGPPDSLAALIADYAALVGRTEYDAQAAHARRALLWEHLLCWLLPYLDSVARGAAAPYARWAEITRAVFCTEAQLTGAPASLPLHLRAAPKADIQAVSHSLDDMIAALFIPIRSGLILTRRDLARVAEALGVAAGFGSRQFILRSLLEAQPQTTLRRLAHEAQHQAAGHANDRAVLGPIADFWSHRAAQTATALAAPATRAQQTEGKPAAVANR